MARPLASLPAALALAGLAAACPDTEHVESITPQIEVGSLSLEFGTVRVGSPSDLPLTLAARSRSPVTLVSVTVEDSPLVPGGAAAFSVPDPLDSIDGDAETDLVVRFSPDRAGDFVAILVIESDDPDPEDTVRRVALSGRGGVPVLEIRPSCEAPCKLFTVAASPPAVDFGPRPALRTDSGGRVVNEPVWPTVTFVNTGEVTLEVESAAFEGAPGFRSKPTLDLGGMTLGPGELRSYRLVFDPQDEAPTPYVADLVIKSDDPATPEARVRLRGSLAPNRAPDVCAGVVEALQPDGSSDMPKDTAGQTTWGGKIIVEPSDHSLVKLSAFSDHFAPGLHPNEAAQGDLSVCTSDYEDGREPLVWRWTLLEKPTHSIASLSGATGPEVSLQPEAYGKYSLGLSVTDPKGATTTTEVAFTALPSRDIAAELTWETPGVDLDLHLVKPGSCGGQPTCFFSRLGDASGYTLTKAGGTLDWGEAGVSWDDPRVDTRDSGDKGLVESVSLSRPENDPSCVNAACPYDLYVHFMRDTRASSPGAPACPGKPCKEGTACGCQPAGNVCVAGRCVTPAAAKVRLYLQPTASRPDAVLTVPLDPETVSLAGPCYAWRVATVTWPSKHDVQTNPNAQVTIAQVGSAGAREFAYFGTLGATSFACEPNTPSGIPDKDVTYLPGQPPTY